MEDKRAELLDYIRVLYERQNDKASKAGMTYWAILAGMIYVLWHMFEAISQFPDPTNTRGYFYYVFSQIHIALIAVALLISRGGITSSKESF